MTRHWRAALALGLMMVGAEAQAQRAPRLSPMAQAVVEERAKILEEAQASGDWYAAELACRELVDRSAAWCSNRDIDALREAERGRRLFRLARLAGEDQDKAFVAAMVNDPGLSAHFLFAWSEQEDDEEWAVRRLLELIEKYAADVGRLPALAAATALVHDRPDRITKRMNENSVTGPDPLELFAFLARNERRLSTPPARQPVEALAFVVDATESIEEMEWALDRYQGQPRIGSRFFEISYDTEHFARGAPKKLTESGEYSLRAILQHGGVCVDQAYFASNVGKALGVPTVTVSARGADVGHCWVGFVEGRGRRVAWNMESGRYDAYEQVEGAVWVPHRDEMRPDSEVALLAGFLSEPDEDRWDAVAAASAVRLWTVSPIEGELEALGKGRPMRRTARTRSSEDRLELLELGLRGCPTYVDGWLLLADLAGTGELDAAQTRAWANSLERLCGDDYPAFAVGVLTNMIVVRPDAAERQRLWDWAYSKFDERKDVAARIRLEQAQDAEEQGDKAKAWSLRTEVVDRYANDTPVVISAFMAMERSLRAEGKVGELPGLYERAWARMTRPSQMGGAFRTGSNWYRVGAMYLAVLTEAGDTRARDVRRRLSAG
ncbi:MAG: hypothetical protein DHS20C14_00800 [Phycisphaeraceae bacterium]|nr:MAG: hypothetical protein DHS20C14_00800 [Phycisphaeraceae bacterium]